MSEVTSAASSSSDSTHPTLEALVRFLVLPLLESPDSLRIDCETNEAKRRMLIRIAFEGEDKGRVFGRGGRNIQAIRTVVQAAAKLNGYTAHLDVFGSPGAPSGGGGRNGGSHGHGRSDRRPSRPRPRH